MRRACREMDGIVDWGESDVKDELKFLFKSGRFQKVAPVGRERGT